MDKLTVSVKEAMDIMRDRGRKVKFDTFTEEIRSGKYPFARVKGQSSGGQYSYEIFTAGLYKWLDRMGSGEPFEDDVPAWLIPIRDNFLKYLRDPVNAAHFAGWLARGEYQ